jgi:hypothetical protein
MIQKLFVKVLQMAFLSLCMMPAFAFPPSGAMSLCLLHTATQRQCAPGDPTKCFWQYCSGDDFLAYTTGCESINGCNTSPNAYQGRCPAGYDELTDPDTNLTLDCVKSPTPDVTPPDPDANAAGPNDYCPVP